MKCIKRRVFEDLRDWATLLYRAWALRPSRGLIQTLFRYSILVCADFMGTKRPASHLRDFSRLLTIFCTFWTFCPTRCFMDKILWIYICQTDCYTAKQTTVTSLRTFEVREKKQLRSRLSSNIYTILTKGHRFHRNFERFPLCLQQIQRYWLFKQELKCTYVYDNVQGNTVVKY